MSGVSEGVSEKIVSVKPQFGTQKRGKQLVGSEREVRRKRGGKGEAVMDRGGGETRERKRKRKKGRGEERERQQWIGEEERQEREIEGKGGVRRGRGSRGGGERRGRKGTRKDWRGKKGKEKEKRRERQTHTDFVMTMETASLRTLSPNTSMLSVGFTSRAWNIASVATGSTADINAPNVKLKTSRDSGYYFE